MDSNLYTNYELWDMAENNEIEADTIIEDREGNQMIYTGKSFQVHYTHHESDTLYVGFTKGDLWEIVGTLSELEDH